MCSVFSSGLISLLAIVFSIVLQGAYCTECRSCFASCSELAHCYWQCRKETATCQGDFCVSRMDSYTEDEYHTVRMGCTNFAPVQSSACYSSGSVDLPVEYCFCNTSYCTVKDENAVIEGPSIKSKKQLCCEVSPLLYTKNWLKSCPDECEGSHCITDFVRRKKQCGMDKIAFHNDLTDSYEDEFNENKSICLHYKAGRLFRVHRCVCRGQFCNENVSSPVYGKKSYVKCHSCQDRHSKFPKKLCSKTCMGTACFISMKSAQLTQTIDPTNYYSLPQLEYGSYEVTAGCVSSNYGRLIKKGCQIEWLNRSDPFTIHCICEGAKCNHIKYMRKSISDAKKHHVTTPSVTIGEPDWIKSQSSSPASIATMKELMNETTLFQSTAVDQLPSSTVLSILESDTLTEHSVVAIMNFTSRDNDTGGLISETTIARELDNLELVNHRTDVAKIKNNDSEQSQNDQPPKRNTRNEQVGSYVSLKVPQQTSKPCLSPDCSENNAQTIYRLVIAAPVFQFTLLCTVLLSL